MKTFHAQLAYVPFSLLLFLSSSIFSDQAAWNTAEQTEKILKFIRLGDTIRNYCAPCNDEFYYTEKIQSIEQNIPEKGFVEIIINDTVADFAYSYVFFKGQWRNIAILAGIPVENVPEILPDNIKESVADEEEEGGGDEGLYDDGVGDEGIETEGGGDDWGNGENGGDEQEH